MGGKFRLFLIGLCSAVENRIIHLKMRMFELDIPRRDSGLYFFNSEKRMADYLGLSAKDERKPQKRPKSNRLKSDPHKDRPCDSIPSFWFLFPIWKSNRSSYAVRYCKIRRGVRFWPKTSSDSARPIGLSNRKMASIFNHAGKNQPEDRQQQQKQQVLLLQVQLPVQLQHNRNYYLSYRYNSSATTTSTNCYVRQRCRLTALLPLDGQPSRNSSHWN